MKNWTEYLYSQNNDKTQRQTRKNGTWRLRKMNEEFHDENSLPRLTIKELRSFKGFEMISDSECEEIINSLVKLAIITYNFKNTEI